MEFAMTRSKTICAAISALMLAVTLVVTSGNAQATFGLASAFADPAYRVNAGYDECRFVDQTDGLGNTGALKICDVVPY